MTTVLASLSSWLRIAEHPSVWCSLSDDERRAVGELLRDRFFELSALPAGEREDAAFRSLVQAIDPVPPGQVEGLSLSFHPTARFQALRFVDEARLDPASRALFARPCRELPELAAVFVDPEELSFRTFENIVPLDRHFEAASLSIGLEGCKELGSKRTRCFSFAVTAPPAARAALDRLDGLGLYVPSLNAVSRGGSRFVFHSARLAEALTEAVRAALPKPLLEGFAHVNPVFRLNRFEPGEEKFRRHVDTPYYDASRHHVSRYTMIVYLRGGRGGRGDPPLRVGSEVAIEEIAPYTCVIFDQSLEHEGSAYLEGRKVFLRTELVFEDASVEHDPAIAELFAKATYFTGESVFAPDLSRWADVCYNRAAAAHFQGLPPGAKEEPFVHKEFRGVHFLSNGYDFWFAKGACAIEECAALALLDVLNARVAGKAFRKLCHTEVVQGNGDGISWIPRFLASLPAPGSSAIFAELDKDALFPPAESGGICCPFHGNEHFDATRCDDIIEVYERAQQFARSRTDPAPILMLGQEVFLDRSRFVVRPGAVHVLSERALAPVNFAACWNYGGSAENYIDVEVKLSALQPLVPPILHAEAHGCHHLRFDFFRNSWMVSDRSYAVPVPRISDIDPGEAEEEGGTPWLDAVDKKSLGPEDENTFPEIYERDDDEDE